MNTFKSPQMNPGTDGKLRAFRAGLDAARVGAVSTAVLYFAGVGVGDEGNGFEYTGDANAASRIAITKSGLYVVSLRLLNAGAAGVVAGVTMNTDNAGLTATPAWSVVGMQDLQTATGVASASPPVNLDAFVTVRGADINAGIAAGNGGAVIRAHALATGGGAPAGLTVASASLTIRRLAPIF